MAERIKPFEQCIPIAAVADDAIIARDGAITIGWEIFPSDEYSLTLEQYDLMSTLMSSAFRSLGEWTMVHRQDIYFRKQYQQDESGHFLDDCFSAHFRGREYLEHRQFIWFTINPAITGKAGVMKPSMGAAANGIRYRSPLMKNLVHTLEHFSSRCAEFVSAFCSSGCFRSRRVTSEMLEGVGGETPGLLEQYKCWFREAHSGSDIRQGKGTYLEREDTRMFSYSFSESDDFPSEVSNTLKERSLSSPDCDILLSSTSPLGGELPFEHIVNIYYLFPEQQFALRELDRRRKNMTAMSSGSAENNVHAEGISQFIDMIHAESTMALFCHMNIIAWGEKGKELSMRGSIGAALSQMGMTGKMNTIDMPQIFLAGFPGAELEIGEDSLMLCELEQAMCLGINETFTRDFPNGTLRICDRRRHIPILIDTQQGAYDAKYIENYNAFILGPSGSGKSFFTNWYVRNCFDKGQHIFIIDKGDSYEGLCSVIQSETEGQDGVYYKWSDEKPFSFAPFLGCRQWSNDEDGALNMSFIMSLIKIIWTPEKGWDSVSDAVLYSLISDFIKSLNRLGDDPTFDDFLNFIQKNILPRIQKKKGHDSYIVGGVDITMEVFDLRSLCVALDSYSAGGRFGFLLNDRHPADLFMSRFVVFEVDAISQIDPILYALCTFCIINSFEKKMRSDNDAFRLMFIEEAWQAIASEATADYLRRLWKTARKYHTSATVVTQQVSDIIASPIIKDAIINNSPVKILLDQKSNAASMDEIASLLGLSPLEVALVRSVGRNIREEDNYREVFISLGGKRSCVYALEVSPEEAMVYESDKVKKRPLMERARKCGDIIQAIKDMRKQ